MHRGEETWQSLFACVEAPTVAAGDAAACGAQRRAQEREFLARLTDATLTERREQARARGEVLADDPEAYQEDQDEEKARAHAATCIERCLEWVLFGGAAPARAVRVSQLATVVRALADGGALSRRRLVDGARRLGVRKAGVSLF